MEQYRNLRIITMVIGKRSKQREAMRTTPPISSNVEGISANVIQPKMPTRTQNMDTRKLELKRILFIFFSDRLESSQEKNIYMNGIFQFIAPNLLKIYILLKEKIKYLFINLYTNIIFRGHLYRVNVRNIVMRCECKHSCRKSASNPCEFEKIRLENVLSEVRNIKGFG